MVFKECQVILFAIKTYAADRDEYEILLNPSNDYIIKKEDLCVYISESPKEIKDIEYLVCKAKRSFNEGLMIDTFLLQRTLRM